MSEFAFNYRKENPFWNKFLKGKIAVLILTTDTIK